MCRMRAPLSSSFQAFVTQLCHTLSFKHNFQTHHLSRTTLSHTLLHKQPSHTPSFFVKHHLSNTALSHTHTIFFKSTFHIHFFYVSILHFLLCLSFLPLPAATCVAHYRKKLACGVIRPFNFAPLLSHNVQPLAILERNGCQL